MKKKNLGLAALSIAGSMLLGSCVHLLSSNLHGEIAYPSPSSDEWGTGAQATSDDEHRGPKRLYEIAEGISQRLFDRGVLNWYDDSQDDFIYFGAALDGFSADELIDYAIDFLVPGFTIEKDASHNDVSPLPEAHFSYDEGSICVDAFTYNVEADSVMAALEYCVHLSDGPRDDESLSSSGPETEDEPIVAIIKGIAIKLRGSCVEGEDWVYYSDYSLYATGMTFPGYSAETLVTLADRFLVDGYTIELDPSFVEEYQMYAGVYSYEDGDILVQVNIYDQDDSVSGAGIEFYAYYAE